MGMQDMVRKAQNQFRKKYVTIFLRISQIMDLPRNSLPAKLAEDLSGRLLAVHVEVFCEMLVYDDVMRASYI